MKCNLEKYFSLKHVIWSLIILTKTLVTYDQIYLRTENHIKSLFVMFLKFVKCVIISDKGYSWPCHQCRAEPRFDCQYFSVTDVERWVDLAGASVSLISQSCGELSAVMDIIALMEAKVSSPTQITSIARKYNKVFTFTPLWKSLNIHDF